MRLVSTLLLAFLAGPLQAKNAILFLGDGMGISTITAARIYAGQLAGQPGEEHELSFDRFENLALIKTYNTDNKEIIIIGHSGSHLDCRAKAMQEALGMQ